MYLLRFYNDIKASQIIHNQNPDTDPGDLKNLFFDDNL